MKGYMPKSSLIILIAIFISSFSVESGAFQKEDSAFSLCLLKGKSFTVTFNLGEDEYSDIITFGEDGSFTMTSLSSIETSVGTYTSFCGILFFANFAGSFPGNPYSFSFYGIYLSPNIFGFDVIDWFGSPFRGTFSGTEVSD